MVKIRKNSIEYKKAIANASNIKRYSIDNNFDGEDVRGIPSYIIDGSSLCRYDNEGKYVLYVHSNLWYTFPIK